MYDRAVSCMGHVNCICTSAWGKSGLTQRYFVVVYDRQGFLFLKKIFFFIRKILCSDKINNFSQSFQCFDEKSDPVMFIFIIAMCYCYCHHFQSNLWVCFSFIFRLKFLPWDFNLKVGGVFGSGLATYCPSIGVKSAQEVLGSSVRILGLALE